MSARGLFRKRPFKWTDIMAADRRRNRPEVSSWGVGPVTLDLDHARQAGWSDTQIERAQEQLSEISKRETSLSHRNGPVDGCECITCDDTVAESELFDSYAVQRASWRRRGLWPRKASAGEGSR